MRVALFQANKVAHPELFYAIVSYHYVMLDQIDTGYPAGKASRDLDSVITLSATNVEYMLTRPIALSHHGFQLVEKNVW